jgi:large subunit ribosomal protein L30e
MARAKKITSSEIKKIIKTKKVVIGTKRTIENLKLGKIEMVLLSSNCPENVINDIVYYAGLGKADTIQVAYPNEEIGVICKKPFSISVLSVLKGEK